ncbi:unnamed protein product [Lathyrus sativus]|nr:unnamed protein product [Lathyrus sativus]
MSGIIAGSFKFYKYSLLFLIQRFSLIEQVYYGIKIHGSHGVSCWLLRNVQGLTNEIKGKSVSWIVKATNLYTACGGRDLDKTGSRARVELLALVWGSMAHNS